MKHVRIASPAAVTIVPSRTATACTRCRASTIPFRRASTTITSTVGSLRPDKTRGLARARPRYACVAAFRRFRLDTGAPLRRRRTEAMPRKPRDSAAGAFHVTAHSVWSAELFRDDIDRHRFVDELARTVAVHRWVCLEVCVLTYALPPDPRREGLGILPTWTQELHSRHAMWFNARHRLLGHVFSGRYSAQQIHTDSQLLTTFRYVARNPFEARR